MFLPCPAIYHKIITKYQKELLELLFEDVVHAGLKSS
jgi:hypothetical protein